MVAHKLDTKSARSKLAPRKAIYWTRVNRKLALGCWKSDKSSTWFVRVQIGNTQKVRKIGSTAEADPDNGLTYSDALDRAQQVGDRMLEQMRDGDVTSSSYTVGDSVNDWMRTLDARRPGSDTGSSTYSVRQMFDKHLPDHLKQMQVASMKPRHLSKWLSSLPLKPVSGNWLLRHLKAALNLVRKRGMLAGQMSLGWGSPDQRRPGMC